MKLKKDYIEKLQSVLDAGSEGPTVDSAARGAKQEEEVDELDPSSGEEEGKHVSAARHAEPLQDPETAFPSAPTAARPEAETESVKEAKEDTSIAITKEDKNEQILGDADGDLGEKMEAAAEAGKAERMEEQGDAAGRTESAKAAAEETKEEGNVAVEAAEAEPPQVVAQEDEKVSATVTEKADDAIDQDPIQTEKRKREDDDGSKDGKRARLSPAPECDSNPDTLADPTANTTSPKRPAQDETTYPLPDKLSHVSHPATRALYISDLRRPLLLPDLKAWLIEQGALDDVQEDVLDDDALPSGVWLDGVKSHCYCIVS